MDSELFHLKISGELCCELCGEVIHNHIECPACGRRNAGTDCYQSIYDGVENVGDVLQCAECGLSLSW